MSIGEWVVLGVLGPIDLAFLVAVWRYRRELDKWISTALGRWLVERHRPQDIGEPADPKPWCFVCRKPWPCKEWMRLHEQKREPAR